MAAGLIYKTIVCFVFKYEPKKVSKWHSIRSLKTFSGTLNGSNTGHFFFMVYRGTSYWQFWELNCDEVYNGGPWSLDSDSNNCTHYVHHFHSLGSIPCLAAYQTDGAGKYIHINVRILPGTHLYSWVESSDVDELSC